MASTDPWAGARAEASRNGVNLKGGTNNWLEGLLKLLGANSIDDLVASGNANSGFNTSRIQNIQARIQALNPANQQAQSQRLQNQAVEGSAQGARQANLANRAGGLGDGFQAGTNNAFASQGQRQANDIRNEYNSPEHMARAGEAQYGAIMQGFQDPQYERLLQLLGFFSQQSANAKQGQKNNLLGSAVGAGLGALSNGGLSGFGFGGGQNASAPAPSTNFGGGFGGGGSIGSLPSFGGGGSLGAWGS